MSTTVLEVTATEVTVRIGKSHRGWATVVDHTMLDNDLLVKMTRSGAESLRDALTEALQGVAS